MRKSFLFAMMSVLFVACNSNRIESQPITYPTEEPEVVTNDFTMVKACIGKSQAEADSLLAARGFSQKETEMYYELYQKTEDGITKDAYVLVPTYAAMTVKTSDFPTQKAVFARWLIQMRQSKTYSHLIRSSYTLYVGYNEGKQSFNTPEELIAAVDTIAVPKDGMYAAFGGNDSFSNRYELVIFPSLKGVYLDINNLRAGKPSNDFTESDLNDADLRKHILICKVDYLTFRYKGFYALNVSDKINTDSIIPIISEYVSPGDFGSIKLYYRNTSNLLLDGTIVWNGSGGLVFPESFRAGQPVKEGIPYPGNKRFAWLNVAGKYVDSEGEQECQNIWKSLSFQKEFQHYYGNSTKKMSVYLYAPSVGLFDPYLAYYLVYIEQ